MNGMYRFTSKLIFTGILVLLLVSVSSDPTVFAEQNPGRMAVPQSSGGMDAATFSGTGALPVLGENFERKTVHPDRSITLEIFDENKVRTAKRLFNATGQLAEEWAFDRSAGNRILRYKIVHYKNAEMLDQRIAFWDYDVKGGYVKNNRIYDSKQHLTGSYLEYVGPNRIKSKEEWFDAGGRMTGRKTWDPNTGVLQPNNVLQKPEAKQEPVRSPDEVGKKSKEEVLGTKLAAPVFHQTERRTTQPDGSLVLEILDPMGRRSEKHLIDIQGHLIKRWIFDPDAKGRITSCETYEYGMGKLQRYRIAEWHYLASGEEMKVNRFFNGEGKQTGGFVEYENAQGKKYQEDWYDSKEKLAVRKIWDPENGAIKVHMRVTYLVGGLQRRTFLNAKGQKISENICMPDGKPLGLGGVTLGGVTPVSADRFKDLKNRDIAMNRPKAES